MRKKWLFTLLVALGSGLGFLLAVSLLGPSDLGKGDPDERARRELRQRQGELALIIDFYPLLSEERYGRADNFPPSVKDGLRVFLASEIKDVKELVKAKQEIAHRRNVLTDQPGLEAQYADYREYSQAKDKHPFRGFLIYQPLECKAVKVAAKEQAAAQSCAHYKIYATGREGQLLNAISR